MRLVTKQIILLIRNHIEEGDQIDAHQKCRGLGGFTITRLRVASRENSLGFDLLYPTKILLDFTIYPCSSHTSLTATLVFIAITNLTAVQ
jgi:hypothetical protein